MCFRRVNLGIQSEREKRKRICGNLNVFTQRPGRRPARGGGRLNQIAKHWKEGGAQVSRN